MAELRDLYDKFGNKTDKTYYKGETIPEGFYPMVVMVYIRNSKGEFLMQKRSKKKGDCWGVTGGHPKSGETPLEGIVTEVKEELGLDFSNENFIEYESGCDGIDCYKMYNMSRVNHNAYFDSMNEDDLYELKKNLNAQRIEDYKNGNYKLGGGCLELPVPEDVPFYVKDYSEYYKGRAYHERSLNSNGGWNVTSSLSFINTPQHTFSGEIRNAVLIIHGEKAHSCYFSKDAYNDMIKNGKYTDNKELMIIPGAVHTDLYDNLEVIPFDKIESFLREYLK